MKATKVLAACALLALSVGVVAACGGKPLTDAPLAGETLADFSAGDPGEKVMFASDGWSNGGSFNTVWTAGNLSYADGALHLGITEEEKSAWMDGKEVQYSYTSGEARTTYYYGYGDYEVRMKPTDVKGTASTFFVCTGNYDKTPEGVENPWDEIDIEFLGKSPTRVQFNYFANGHGGHEHMYDLGFDASKEYHNYGFRWAEDYITWFVDGQPVYRVEKPSKGDFPQTAGRILMNYWCGNKDGEGWMGKFAGADGKTADYAWVKTSAAKQNPPMGDPYPDTPAPAPTPGETLDWSKVEAQELAFPSTEKYTVTPAADKKSAQVTYSGVTTDYSNIEMDIASLSAGKNAMALKLKNNGTAAVNVRINLVNAEKLAAGAQNSAVNTEATQDGAAVRTDLEWGGSYFDLSAGKEAECVVMFEGTADKLQLMIDSAIYGNTEAKSGDLTVSALKFANAGETPAPSVPEGDPVALTFNVEENAGYTVTAGEDNKSATLAYQGKGNTYKPVTAECAALAAGKNVFTLTIKNNKAEPVTVRVDVQGTTSVSTGEGSSTDCTNVSATCTGGSGLYTDTTWGGTKITLAAEEEVTLTIAFDATMAQGAVKNILIFVDSMGGDENDHDASVTVSGFLFTTKED